MIVLSMINKYLSHTQCVDRPAPQPRTAGALARFNHLVRAHQDEAYAFASYLLGDPALAQQATQQAVQDAYQTFDPARSDSGFRGWLLKHVRSAAQSMARTQLPAPHGPVARALVRLDETSRALLILVDMQAMDYAEAAQVLDMTGEDISRRLARARRQFSAQIGAASGAY